MVHVINKTIWSVSGEKDYDTSYFADQVERVYVDDHNVPTLRYVL